MELLLRRGRIYIVFICNDLGCATKKKISMKSKRRMIAQQELSYLSNTANHAGSISKSRRNRRDISISR